jgi:DNA-binding ferritin-like protein (Dps family)
MKTSYRIILVLAMAAAVLSTTAVYCRAAEDVNKEEDNIWSEDTAKGEHGRFELTEEKIERIMNRLAETDPAKAEELKQLQGKDPEKFKAELREVMREQFGKRFKERMEERSERHMKKFGEPFGPRGTLPGPCNTPPIPCPIPLVTACPNGMPPGMGMQRHGEPFGPGHMLPEMGMRWRYDKYLDWLKENYAVEAEKLAELSEKDPNLYWKQLGLGLKKYGRIAEAARENPQLAEVLKKDLSLRQQQDKLLGEIEAAGDKEKEELVKDLKEVISNRFDVIVERKQIEYEQLLEKLERLKNEVEQRKAKMEKWKDAKFKDESVKARLEELLGKSDKFTW